MAIALSEYAPGAQIVIDGRVYRSDGITLNWQIVGNDGTITENQKFQIAWQCHRCGGSGVTGLQFNNRCSHCGEDLIQRNIKEFLEPSGFATRFYSEPNNDITSQIVIPSNDPWITANGELEPLPNDRLGYYKNDTSGNIFFSNSGLNGNGFAVCLSCGRAESLLADGRIPHHFMEHGKLRGSNNPQVTQNQCNPSPNQIRHLHLLILNYT